MKAASWRERSISLVMKRRKRRTMNPLVRLLLQQRGLGRRWERQRQWVAILPLHL